MTGFVDGEIYVAPLGTAADQHDRWRLIGTVDVAALEILGSRAVRQLCGDESLGDGPAIVTTESLTFEILIRPRDYAAEDDT